MNETKKLIKFYSVNRLLSGINSSYYLPHPFKCFHTFYEWGFFKISWLFWSQYVYICISNSMICSDIWHKYHEWYFEIVICNFTSCYASEIWYNFEISWAVFYAKCHVQIMLFFVYTTICKRFVIFTRRYFKISGNTTALSQSNCRNFSCGSINRLFT